MFLGFSSILWVSGILCLVAYTVSAQTQDDPEKSNLYLGLYKRFLYLTWMMIMLFEKKKWLSFVCLFVCCSPGVMIIIVVIVTGLFGYAQDRTSSKIMDSFKKMITHSATVIRDGKVSNIPSVNLVKGDVVLIKFGSKVPADVRIIECFGMKVFINDPRMYMKEQLKLFW